MLGRMNPTRKAGVIVYRVAAVVLLVFCFFHTVGGMLSHGSNGVAADAVLAAMKRVHFDVFGAECSYYGFYFGFGMTTSVFLLLAAGMAWFLGGMSPEGLRQVAPLAWMLFASQVVLAVLCWAYFFPPPGVFATAAAALTFVGALRSRSRPEPAMAAGI